MTNLRDRQHGFTLLEVMIVVGIAGVIAAAAVPMATRTLADLRVRNDAQSLANMVALTKMRAASHSARTRLFVDLGSNTYYLQKWDRTLDSWITEGGAIATSTGVEFGFGTVSEPPPDTQVAIDHSPACTDDDGDSIGNTACIVFNSRGIPIDSTGDPYGGNALYLTDGTSVFGTTITATPLVRLWWTPANRIAWTRQ